MSHFIVQCTCSKVIRQCRCPGSKVRSYELCDECKQTVAVPEKQIFRPTFGMFRGALDRDTDN